MNVCPVRNLPIMVPIARAKICIVNGDVSNRNSIRNDLACRTCRGREYRILIQPQTANTKVSCGVRRSRFNLNLGKRRLSRVGGISATLRLT